MKTFRILLKELLSSVKYMYCFRKNKQKSKSVNVIFKRKPKTKLKLFKKHEKKINALHSTGLPLL